MRAGVQILRVCGHGMGKGKARKDLDAMGESLPEEAACLLLFLLVPPILPGAKQHMVAVCHVMPNALKR